MHLSRGLIHRLHLAVIVAFGFLALVQPAAAETITVIGNHHVSAETIRGYLSEGDDGAAKRALLATGLFASVSISHTAAGTQVAVVENAGTRKINRVAFEGNSKIKSTQLEDVVQLKSRGQFDSSVAQSDVERLNEVYRRNGRNTAHASYRLVTLPDGRVDVVYTIDEGEKTGIKEINFVGNHVYSASRLRGLMQLTESNFLSFFKTSDVYDPDKFQTDQELIRRFYLKHGYADFRITRADVTYDPAQKGYVLTIAVDEGLPYRVGTVGIDSHIPGVAGPSYLGAIDVSPGDVYDAVDVERSLEKLTAAVQRRGHAFVQVRPRGERLEAMHVINLRFIVDDGPRVYIERIDIHGNTRTRDYVIRREFDIGEGDAYNQVLIDKAERRLNALGYFKKVKITNEPGSSADRVVIDVDVTDQPTGSFGIAGGYSTTDGFIGEVSVSESNFLGRGQYVKLAVTEGQYSRGAELSFTEPYFLDQRVAAGFDIFHKETDSSTYTDYGTVVTGGTVRFGLPLTEEVTFTPKYSLYTSKVEIENTAQQPYDDCTDPIAGVTQPYDPTTNPVTFGNCLGNGEVSLAAKQASGARLVSLVGYTLSYNTLDSNKDPTSGFRIVLNNDAAGAGGDAHFVRATADLRYYHEVLFDDVIGIVHLQGGAMTGFGNEKNLFISDQFILGPDLVRGFAPGGIGPRDISPGIDSSENPLGGTRYYGGSLEVQFPLGLPRELGFRGAVFADAGSLFGYEGQTNFSNLLGLPAGTKCDFNRYKVGLQNNCVTVDDSDAIRSSVGASLIWASPIGPIRFDYAFVLSKAANDQTQAFRFSGGSTF